MTIREKAEAYATATYTRFTPEWKAARDAYERGYNDGYYVGVDECQQEIGRYYMMKPRKKPIRHVRKRKESV